MHTIERFRLVRKFVVLITVFMVVFCGVGVSGVVGAPPEEDDAPQGPPPALVKVGVVEVRELQNRWPVTGRLREVRRSTVAAEQEGKIVEVMVEDGDAVVGGKTVMAKVDPVWAELSLASSKASVQEAEASVAQAETQLDQAERDMKQIKLLFDRRTTTQKELDDVQSVVREREARLASAVAALASAAAELRRAQENVARLVIVAPFDGTVVSKMVEVGRWVRQGEAVAEVVSRGRIDAIINVPEGIVNNLKGGVRLPIRIDALGVEVGGVVKAVVPSGSNAARTFPVRVRLDDEGGRFKPGMSVTAMVPMNEKGEYTTVPRDAVLGGDLGDVVWIDAGGIGLPVGVRVLFGEGDRLAVKVNAGGGGPGLMPGMSVVIEGAERLFPTRPLMIANPPKGGGVGSPQGGRPEGGPSQGGAAEGGAAEGGASQGGPPERGRPEEGSPESGSGSGIASSGITRSGSKGSGITSSGITSSGITSSGITRSGSKGSGITSSGSGGLRSASSGSAGSGGNESEDVEVGKGQGGGG